VQVNTWRTRASQLPLGTIGGGLLLTGFIYMMIVVFWAMPASAGGVNSMTGSGTLEEPFLVTNAAQLNEVRNDLTAYYKQTADIALTGNWSPIGVSSGSAFTGNYDGNGKHISGLTINATAANAGFFGYVKTPGVIKNLTLDSVSISSSMSNVGALVGFLDGGTVSDAHVNGGSVSAVSNVGGLAGISTTGAQISLSSSSANVESVDSLGNYVGGLVSRVSGSSLIANSYASGRVAGKDSVGGLAGSLLNSTLTNTYARGEIASTSSLSSGGLFGETGNNTVTSSYYDTNTSGKSDSRGSKKTTEQMGQEATYSGWDFTSIWVLDDRDGYPTFISHDTVTPAVKSATVEKAQPNQVVVIFYERVTSQPLETSRFAVKVDALDATVTSGQFTNPRTLTLTLSAPVMQGQTVTLDYGAGTSPITDTKGNVLAVFNNQQVTNNVVRLSTDVSVTGSVTEAIYGQSVTLTATVTGEGGGTPTGTVTFKDGTTVIGTATLNGSGVARLTTDNLTEPASSATMQITAEYGGDSDFSPADSQPVQLKVYKTVGSSYSRTPSVISAVYGQEVAFTIEMTPETTLGGAPSGMVEFWEGSSKLGVSELALAHNNTYSATWSTAGLPVGPHTIMANYVGDTASLGVHPADSASFATVSVGKAHVDTALTATITALVYGEETVLTAAVTVVSPGAGVPEGTVTFLLDGTVPIGDPVTLVNGTATGVPLSVLVLGPHGVTASYSGSGNYLAGETNGPLSITVVKSDNAKLGSLALTDGSGQPIAITPAFDPALLTYTAIVSYQVTGVQTTAVTQNEFATLKINGDDAVSGAAAPLQQLIVGTNTVTADVYAQNGDRLTYPITVERLARVPDAPTGVTAVAGESIGQAEVSFTPPVNDGGAPIASYTVKSSPGGITATGSSSPIRVTGLTGGTAYTFTVTATSAAGTSEASSPSGIVIPKSPSPPSSSDTDSTNNSLQTETITVDVENGENGSGSVVSKAVISRTTDATGRKTDTVNLTPEQAASTVEQLASAGSSSARLVIPDPKDQVSALNVNLPKASMATLADAGVGLEISTANAQVVIASSSLQGLKEDLYFRLVPLKEENERQAAEQRAKDNQLAINIIGGGDLQVIGRPMTIETNMQNRPVTLVLPLGGQALSEDQLKDLGVFIEHSDGTKEWVKGEIVPYDKNGQYGIRFDVTHFSTFTVVYMPSPAAPSMHKAYISGYPDGTFSPDRSITRAELASMLARVYESEAGQPAIAFTDIGSTDWAKEAVDKVASSGMMEGYPDGSFKPGQPVTRAEMASIEARLMEKARGTTAPAASAGGGSFSDTDGHWAEAAIERVRVAGIISGYADGTFRPDQALTRAEAVTMINKLLGRGPLVGVKPIWPDVAEGNWAFGNIQEASVDHTYEQKPDREQWTPAQ